MGGKEGTREGGKEGKEEMRKRGAVCGLTWPRCSPFLYFPPHGQVAQLVEQRTENPRVGGSIPSLAILRKSLEPNRLPNLMLPR
jgi:hypothetical protein